jgi:predicted HTH domain antitoxin
MSVVVELPEDTALALRISPEKLGGEISVLAAVKLYELGRLSSGAAARVAGMPRAVFLSKLGEYGVSTFDVSADDLRREAELD